MRQRVYQCMEQIRNQKSDQAADFGMIMLTRLYMLVKGWKNSIEDARQLIQYAGNDMQQMILEMRFINGMKWADIARETGYRIETVQMIKKKSVKNISDAYKRP